MSKLILFLVFIVCSSCTNWLYAPQHDLMISPEQIPIHPQSFFVNVTPNEKINVWVFKTPIKKPLGTFIFFHGNGENQSTHFRFFYWALAYGYNLVSFDYRGYGLSDGTVKDPQQTVEDGEKIFSFVSEQQLPRPFVAIGQSLGGAVLMKTLSQISPELRPDVVVLDSTFLSYVQAADSVLSQRWILAPLKLFTGLVIDNSWAPKARDLQSFANLPKIVIHTKDDTLIQYKLGEDLYNKLSQPKFFWPVEDGNHTAAFADRHQVEFSQKLLRCLDGLFNKKDVESYCRSN